MRLILPLLLAATPLWAEGFSTEISGDFTGDGIEDYAALIRVDGTEEADLVVQMSNGSGEVRAERLVFVGYYPGQKPSLAITPHGSLQVREENISMGINRWWMVLTLAYRDGALRMAGFTHEHYNPYTFDGGHCDLNFLTQRGKVNSWKGSSPDLQTKSIRVSSSAVPVTDWVVPAAPYYNNEMPAECALVFD